MENQVNSKSIILNNGLYLGVLGAIVGLCLWASGQYFELQWVGNLVGFLATLFFIIVGIKKFKSENGGFMSWGQGLKIGMGIVMVSAVITVLYTLLLTNVIDPNLQAEGMAIQEQAWIDQGLSSDQIDSAKEMTEKFQSPLIISGVIFIFAAFIGFVISAITAAIMKKSEEDTY